MFCSLIQPHFEITIIVSSSSSKPSSKDLPVVPDVSHSVGRRSGPEGAAAAQPRTVILTCTAAELLIWAQLSPHASLHVAPQVILKLQGSQLPDSSQLQQYSLRCEEEDKFLLIYTLLRLRLVQGKTLVFVGALDRCYRLKLFLEQFGVPACVLNSELPVQSRWGLLCR